MKTAYIVDAVRTPIGKYAGALAAVRPDDLAAIVLRALIERNPGLDPAAVEDVILGAANQAGEDNRNVARMAALLAGLPVSVPGATVNRLCGSGLQAIADAARCIQSGEGDVYIAGGTESMSRAPFVMPKADKPFGRDIQLYDTTLGWRFTNPKLAEKYYPFTMGETAEEVAAAWNITRQQQDEWAHRSQQYYRQAADKGYFTNEIIPVTIPRPKGEPIVVSEDEQPRLSSLEDLAKLKPAFRTPGTVTAGNAAGLNDGASALLLMSEEGLKRFNARPLARVVSTAVAGVTPEHMGIGPVPASRKALERAGITIADLSRIELNEAFAAQVLACLQELQPDPAIVNVSGGGIAFGHPLGASGARLSTTLLHELQRNPDTRYGLATMCIGVGQGISIVYERL